MENAGKDRRPSIVRTGRISGKKSRNKSGSSAGRKGLNSRKCAKASRKKKLKRFIEDEASDEDSKSQGAASTDEDPTTSDLEFINDETEEEEASSYEVTDAEWAKAVRKEWRILFKKFKAFNDLVEMCSEEWKEKESKKEKEVSVSSEGASSSMPYNKKTGLGCSQCGYFEASQCNCNSIFNE